MLMIKVNLVIIYQSELNLQKDRKLTKNFEKVFRSLNL